MRTCDLGPFPVSQLQETAADLAEHDAVEPVARRREPVGPRHDGEGEHHDPFQLRPGLRWSNGDRLTANDFVQSFRRLVDPRTKSPSAFLAAPIQNGAAISSGTNRRVEALGVEAIGADVVRITLSAPTPYFLAALTNASFSPVHSKGLAITNGPYVLHEWSPGARIVLKRNRYYWDAPHVQIAEVQYLPMPDVSKEYAHYLAGDVDITWDVPADRIASLRASRPVELKVFPYFGLYYYTFDLNRPPFKGNQNCARRWPARP